MARVLVSHAAKADLLGIGRYTAGKWGPAQAARYLGDLKQTITLLAHSPSLGRSCDWIRPGLRRFEKARHSIFYRAVGRDIFVARILHQNMLPGEQYFPES